MKILVTTYSTAFLNIGGGESEFVQVVDALSSGGMQVDIYGVDSRPIEYYDLVMHFSVQPEGIDLYHAVTKQKKVVLWPNVWFANVPGNEEVERIHQIANAAHKLLFKSKVEKANFLRFISVDPEKCIVVPIFVSEKFLSNVDTDIAKTVVEFDDYVLCLGRIEPIKNQLTTIHAVQKLGIHAVMVGGYSDQSYFDACKAANQGYVQFLPFIKPCSALLLSLIANSDLVIELSFDPAGRSTLEAAALKKPLLLSDDAWVEEYFADTVYKANPNDLESVVSALSNALLDKKCKALASHQHLIDHVLPTSVEVMVKSLIQNCI